MRLLAYLFDMDSHMKESVESEVRRVKGIPQGIIDRQAEESSERYVADLALEGEERETTKQVYMEAFKESIINNLTY